MKKVILAFISLFFLSAIPAFACTSVATPDTLVLNTRTSVQLGVTNLNSATTLVGFNCDYTNGSPNGGTVDCSVNNFLNIPGWTNNGTNNEQNWTQDSQAGVDHLTIGADYQFNSTGDKTFAVYGVNGSNEDECDVTLHVVNANQNPTVNTISNATINEGDTYSASGSFTDNNTNATSWTATVDYGDGSGSQPLTLSGMNFSLSHQYTTSGTFTVTVSVTNNQGETGTGTATVTVNVSHSCTSVATPDTISINTRTPVQLAVSNLNSATTLVGFNCDYQNGTPTYAVDCSPSDFSNISGWTINSWAEGANWTQNDSTGVDHLTIGADLQFNSLGDKTFAVYGINGSNENECDVTLHVVNANHAPTVGAITVSPNPVQVSTATSASASFTDADTTDTHTASWNWGDGNTTTGTVTETNGSGSVSDSHTYTSAGVYPITLTVTDNHGAPGAQTFQYVSVYNPTSQGLFSAGQKYTSPAGAYAANSSLTGNVKFGLSYKYQGTVPTGTRQFSMDFNTANFHFNATSVSSLVISNGIGTLTGTGTLNGSGPYTFLVTGSESANTIRIQIKDSSGNVVYDTQPGAADTATPTTSVTGNVLAH